MKAVSPLSYYYDLWRYVCVLWGVPVSLCYFACDLYLHDVGGVLVCVMRGRLVCVIFGLSIVLRCVVLRYTFFLSISSVLCGSPLASLGRHGLPT